ncbi:uncharacterized protein FIBRA_04095 [Fibroporia radiculosa]|uniref:Uncharacterized protein n=1 Tax=Fibroporia radiculosa TaxID=599839 RepID=J4H2S2_9APHY|nr:uncharacterized protein FIBRA_04095 [Fibroporia radiculosa]CCM02019.1 predicted protein [Fibroporia radiculosa]
MDSPDLGVQFVPTRRFDTYPAIDPAKANLKDKVVLITGASRGIGKVIATSFTQAGVSGLILLARSDLTDTKSACEAAKRPGQSLKVLTITADTSRPEQISSAFEKIRETFERLDIVVNNAGYLAEYDLIADSDLDQVWQTWAVNMLGTYAMTRAALPWLIESGGDKTIVNVGSLAGLMKLPKLSAYNTSKLALLRFTELTMVEYGDKGVLAHFVHPGLIDTGMAAKVPFRARGGGIPPYDTPELAAHTIVWLVSERRDWLAGRYVSAQWDMEELSAKEQEIVDGDKLKVKMVV